MVHIGNDWDALLKDEFQKEYYLRLRQFLAYDTGTPSSIRICMTSLTR